MRKKEVINSSMETVIITITARRIAKSLGVWLVSYLMLHECLMSTDVGRMEGYRIYPYR